MITIYEGQVIPGPPITPSRPLTVPDNIVFLNIYNISPHRLTVSLSGGYPDIYFPPFYYFEGLYMGVQGGATLTIGQDRSHARTVTVTKVTADTGLATLPGDLSVIGFRKDENWQGVKPLIAGAISPTSGAGVATSIVNTGQPALTPIITANASGTQGNIRVNNDGSLTIQLQDLGAAATMLSFANGVGVGNASAVLGIQTSQSDLTIWGVLGKILADPSAPLTIISSDGSGNLTTHTVKAAVSTVSAAQICFILADGATGKTWNLEIDQTTGNMFIFETVAAHRFIEFDITNNRVIFNGPLILRSGTQESRSCSGRGVAAVAGNNWGGWVAFQHDMTNLPSSVTLTQTLNTNVTTATAVDITKTGFRLELVATAAGNFIWEGTYATVGN